MAFSVAPDEQGESFRNLPKGCVRLGAVPFRIVPTLQPVGFEGLDQLASFGVFKVSVLDHLDGCALPEDVVRFTPHGLT
jgi:hypothetical protein